MPSPEHDAVVAMMRSMREQRPAPPTLTEQRAQFEAMAELFPLPPEATVEAIDIVGVPAERVSVAGSATDRTILYLHGGGYCIGSPATHREFAARLARTADATVVVVDYRLAPEHPFPAAVDDATAAYRWLLDQGREPSRIVIAGDSAGGGLTVATLVALRDQGLALPAAGVCLSPWVDLTGTGDSMRTKVGVDPLIEEPMLADMAAAYLAGADARTPLASPLYADLAGLPPLLIQVGTAEMLLDDAVRLADRARQAQVDVTLEPFEDLVHVFQIFPALPEARDAVDRIGAFIVKHAS
ncbi:MAG TPA: alpha/beta hydrolase [Acidimicrobiales bacterium]|nr:alpha/beta hydrolase [Acidimicrobiales bacterium]